ncbi:MAG: hydroxymethylbilane synthase [Bacillota bacterium]
MKEVIIGTRSSQLAIAQSKLIANKLADEFPEYEFNLEEITTQGDKILDKQLREIGGKKLFIKEIEVALLEKEIDLAIHSLKDMPAQIDDDLEIAAFPKRANPLDALITEDNKTIDELEPGAKIGTGSLRRKAQLLNYRSDLVVEPIRGNIDTRLDKLVKLDLAGIVLAVAGLERMGWEDKISQYLSPQISIPAAGQGALALETRANDEHIKELLFSVQDQDTIDTVQAERSFLEHLGGDCKTPIGAYAQIEGEKLNLSGMVANENGTKLLRDNLVGSRNEATKIGVDLAQKLIEQGAAEILAEIEEGH